MSAESDLEEYAGQYSDQLSDIIHRCNDRFVRRLCLSASVKYGSDVDIVQVQEELDQFQRRELKNIRSIRLFQTVLQNYNISYIYKYGRFHLPISPNSSVLSIRVEAKPPYNAGIVYKVGIVDDFHTLHKKPPPRKSNARIPGFQAARSCRRSRLRQQVVDGFHRQNRIVVKYHVMT